MSLQGLRGRNGQPSPLFGDAGVSPRLNPLYEIDVSGMPCGVPLITVIKLKERFISANLFDLADKYVSMELSASRHTAHNRRLSKMAVGKETQTLWKL